MNGAQPAAVQLHVAFDNRIWLKIYDLAAVLVYIEAIQMQGKKISQYDA